MRASFIILRFFMPKPPLSLGVVTLSHATKGFPFPATSEPLHTPCLLILSMDLSVVACILMVHIVYIGIDETALSTNVILPAIVSHVAAEEILLSILVTRGAKCSTFGLVVPMGSPKYGNGYVPNWQPRIPARC